MLNFPGFGSLEPCELLEAGTCVSCPAVSPSAADDGHQAVALPVKNLHDTNYEEKLDDVAVFRSTATKMPFSDDSWPSNVPTAARPLAIELHQDVKYPIVEQKLQKTSSCKNNTDMSYQPRTELIQDNTSASEGDSKLGEADTVNVQVDLFGLTQTWGNDVNNSAIEDGSSTGVEELPVAVPKRIKTSRPRPISLDLAEQFVTEEIHSNDVSYEMEPVKEVCLSDDKTSLLKASSFDTETKIISIKILDSVKPSPPVRSIDTKLVSTNNVNKKPLLPVRSVETKLSFNNDILPTYLSHDGRNKLVVDRQLFLSEDLQSDRISKLKAELNARKHKVLPDDNYAFNNNFELDDLLNEDTHIDKHDDIEGINSNLSDNFVSQKSSNSYFNKSDYLPQTATVWNEKQQKNIYNHSSTNENPCWTESLTSHDNKDCDWLSGPDGRAPQNLPSQLSSSFGRGKVLDYGLQDHSNRDIGVRDIDHNICNKNVRNTINKNSSDSCFSDMVISEALSPFSNNTKMSGNLERESVPQFGPRDTLQSCDPGKHQQELAGNNMNSIDTASRTDTPYANVHDNVENLLIKTSSAELNNVGDDQNDGHTNVSNPWYRFLTNRRSIRNNNKPKIPPKPPALKGQPPAASSSPPALPARSRKNNVSLTSDCDARQNSINSVPRQKINSLPAASISSSNNPEKAAEFLPGGLDQRSSRLEPGIPGSVVSGFHSQCSSTLPSDIIFRTPTNNTYNINSKNINNINADDGLHVGGGRKVSNSIFYKSSLQNSSSSALDVVASSTSAGLQLEMSASSSNVAAAGSKTVASSAQRASLWRKWREEASALLGKNNGNGKTNNGGSVDKSINNGQVSTNFSCQSTTDKYNPRVVVTNKKYTNKVVPARAPAPIQYQSYCVGADKYQDDTEISQFTELPRVASIVTTRPPLPKAAAIASHSSSGGSNSMLPTIFRRKPNKTQGFGNNISSSCASDSSIDSPPVPHQQLQSCTNNTTVSCVCGVGQCAAHHRQNSAVSGRKYNSCGEGIGGVSSDDVPVNKHNNNTNYEGDTNISSKRYCIVSSSNVNNITSASSINGSNFSSQFPTTFLEKSCVLDVCDVDIKDAPYYPHCRKSPPVSEIIHSQEKDSYSTAQFKNCDAKSTDTSNVNGCVGSQREDDGFSPLLETDLDTGASRDLLDQIGLGCDSFTSRDRPLYSSGRSLQHSSDRSRGSSSTTRYLTSRHGAELDLQDEPCTDLDDLQKDLNELLTDIQRKYSSRDTAKEDHHHQFVRSRSAVFSTKFSLQDSDTVSTGRVSVDRASGVTDDGQNSSISSEYGCNSMTSDRTADIVHSSSPPTTTQNGQQTSSSEVLSRARSLVAVNMCSSNRLGGGIVAGGVGRGDRHDERTRSLEHLLDGEDMAVSTALRFNLKHICVPMCPPPPSGR